MKLYKPFRLLTLILFVVALASINLLNNNLNRQKVVDSSHVSAIYSRLAVNSGHQDIPPLLILDSEIANAWTDGQIIVITTSMLNMFENDDQLAMVLAHEIAHFINKDVGRSDGEVLPNDIEAHADKLGAFIMMRAGFDECKGKEVFKVFKREFGDTATPVGHPDFAYRHDQLNLPMCS